MASSRAWTWSCGMAGVSSVTFAPRSGVRGAAGAPGASGWSGALGWTGALGRTGSALAGASSPPVVRPARANALASATSRRRSERRGGVGEDEVGAIATPEGSEGTNILTVPVLRRLLYGPRPGPRRLGSGRRDWVGTWTSATSATRV